MAYDSYGNLQFMDNLKGTYSIMWTLHEFSKLSAYVSSCRMSQKFSLRHNCSTLCQMAIYPDGIDDNTSGFICCSLICDKRNTSLTSLFYLLYQTGEEIPFHEGCYKVEENKSNFCGRMIRHADLMKHLPNDTLVVIVRGGYSTVPVVSVERQEIPTQDEIPPSDYALLYESGSDADAVIAVDGQEIPVHSKVLSARSKVFWDTFSTHPTEKHARLEITDFRLNIVKLFLQFLYCNTFRIDNVDIACELVRIGHVYRLENLKNVCAKYVCDNIDDENVVRLIILADANDASELRSDALDHFAKCTEAIALEKHEADLVKRPKLVLDMVRKTKEAYLSITPTSSFP